MRRALVTFALAAVALAPSSSLGLSFSGTLSVQYSSDVLLSVAGSGTSVDGPAGAFDLPAGAFSGDDGPVSSETGPPGLVAGELRDILTGAGSFAAGAGTMSVGGELIHYFFDDSPGFSTSLPLAVVGVGGSEPVSGFFTGTVTGSPWTTGAISVVGNVTLNASGFDSRDPDGTGAIRFVTPIGVVLDGGGGPVVVAAYAQLDLVFVPEPGTLALVGFGVGLLAAARRGLRGR